MSVEGDDMLLQPQPLPAGLPSVATAGAAIDTSLPVASEFWTSASACQALTVCVNTVHIIQLQQTIHETLTLGIRLIIHCHFCKWQGRSQEAKAYVILILSHQVSTSSETHEYTSTYSFLTHPLPIAAATILPFQPPPPPPNSLLSHFSDPMAAAYVSDVGPLPAVPRYTSSLCSTSTVRPSSCSLLIAEANDSTCV
jgi:hypothetical protein